MVVFDVLDLVTTVLAKRLAAKSIFEITFFASSGNLNLNSINQSLVL